MSIEKLPVYVNFPDEDKKLSRLIKWIKYEIYRPISNRINYLLGRVDGLIVNANLVVGSPYTILPTDDDIFVDTDAGDVTVNLPAIIQGKKYRVINVGTSGNLAFLAPDGTDSLIGENSAIDIDDSEAVIVTGETTKGWY